MLKFVTLAVIFYFMFSRTVINVIFNETKEAKQSD